MRYLSLFSGIEAATIAWHELGFKPAAFAEIEPFPCAVLQHHYPDVPNLGNVTKITEQDIAALGAIDIVVFGSPCQDLSVAGARKGLVDDSGNHTRSGLFFTAINIFKWARKHCGCRFALWENVPGAYSSNKGRDFAAVVEHMAGLDDVAVPKNGWGTEGCAVGDNGMLEWACLDAQWAGLAQRRRRVFAVIDTGDWSSRAPILLEPHSLRGDSAPSRETREEITHDVAPCLTSSGRGVERTGESRGQDPVVALSVALRGRDGGATAELGDDVGFTLRASGGGGDKPHVLCMAHGQAGAEINKGLSPTLNCNHEQPIIAFPERLSGTQYASTENLSPSLCARNPMAVSGVPTTQYSMIVRRLTPVECARLQGFPDDYLDIEFRGKPAADGNKYKALGNSMAVPVMRHIGRKIKTAVEHCGERRMA